MYSTHSVQIIIKKKQMKKNKRTPQKFKSLSDAFSALGLPAPQHPLIALINGIDKPLSMQFPTHRHVLNFYKISYRPYLGRYIKIRSDLF